jgi:hypothetical protein
MNLTLLYSWQEVVESHFGCLKKWQAIGLAMLSFGIVLLRGCSLSQVAEELSGIGKISSLEKRLKRWVSNPRIDVMICCEAWMGWVWRQYDAQRPILLVDETKLGDRIGVMMVSLAFQQRAIPLVWRCYVANDADAYPQQGQVLLVWQLLARVLSVIPLACRPVVQMDRGLAHSSAMLKALNNLGVTYLVRVKGAAIFTSRRGHHQALKEMIKCGEALKASGYLFRGHKQVKVIVHLVWMPVQREAWYLVTNDKDLPAPLYARRMWQEESFRDLKSGGWQWEGSHITCPYRMERLILALALAYAWMLTLGAFAFHADADTQRCIGSRDDFKRLSIFRLGLRFFKHFSASTPHRLFVGLFFPHPPYQLLR